MAKVSPLQFIQQVRTEVGKVHWPTRREVMLTTIMVFIMAALAATFFSLTDLAIRTGLSAVVGGFGA
ncbi:preprotein translocase subunit SecE [Gemmobacter serpentinus]|uniref:preprotein translocase subunit SecE n=1 Tax=Gemmobacter serpentinus TaxID=2652247 RepID=UPI00124EE7C1|nr:preprotein translocase subunit SecE [Gemmobacter serpentinus]